MDLLNKEVESNIWTYFNGSLKLKLRHWLRLKIGILLFWITEINLAKVHGFFLLNVPTLGKLGIEYWTFEY